ncbi:FAD binding protein [Aureococcus anophagefferens]|nr:FAD binding protein [Aureococcus anophagefferens]
MGRHALAFGLIATCGALLAPRAPRAPRARRAAASVEDVDAVVVGCGPAGLAAAIELRARATSASSRSTAWRRPTRSRPSGPTSTSSTRGPALDGPAPGLTAARRGVSSGNYTVSRLYPDARGVETVAPLLARPAAAGAIWIRASLLAAPDCASDRGARSYGAALEGLEREGGAVVASAGGAAYRTRLLSPSGGLRYKMLEVDPAFAATDLRTGARVATASAQAYVVPSKAANKRDASASASCRRDPALPRTANVIRAAGHRVWDLETGDDVLAWLKVQFPQLNGAVSAERRCNAALEDVAALGDAAAASRRPTWAYQRARAPAARAIAKLVQIGFPFQYDQSRVRSKLFLGSPAWRRTPSPLRLLPPRAAAAVAPPPAAFAVLDGEPYVDILARLTRANRAVAAVAAAPPAPSRERPWPARGPPRAPSPGRAAALSSDDVDADSPPPPGLRGRAAAE